VQNVFQLIRTPILDFRRYVRQFFFKIGAKRFSIILCTILKFHRYVRQFFKKTETLKKLKRVTYASFKKAEKGLCVRDFCRKIFRQNFIRFLQKSIFRDFRVSDFGFSPLRTPVFFLN
jgi:hypothetical protein